MSKILGLLVVGFGLFVGAVVSVWAPSLWNEVQSRVPRKIEIAAPSQTAPITSWWKSFLGGGEATASTSWWSPKPKEEPKKSWWPFGTTEEPPPQKKSWFSSEPEPKKDQGWLSSWIVDEPEPAQPTWRRSWNRPGGK